MDAPNKQHFLSRPPGWCLFPAGGGQSFSSGLCALGHGEEGSAPPATQGKQNPQYKMELLSGAARAQGTWCLQEGQRKQAEVCSACCARHSLSPNACHCCGVQPCPLGKVLLSHLSLECRAPRALSPGVAGTGLTSSPLPFPAQGSMKTSWESGGSQLVGELGLGQCVPVRDGLSGSWVRCHLCPQMVA